jgi:hypothetical protein
LEVKGFAFNLVSKEVKTERRISTNLIRTPMNTFP